MLLYIPEGHGCAYSIDTEGELFYTPLNTNNELKLEETDFVDDYDEEVKEIHEQLIEMYKIAGLYFKNWNDLQCSIWPE